MDQAVLSEISFQLVSFLSSVIVSDSSLQMWSGFSRKSVNNAFFSQFYEKQKPAFICLT